MKFAATRIVTGHVPSLAKFYEEVTGLIRVGNENYVEIETAAGTLAICSQDAVRMFNANAAEPKANHSLILEFEVDDVDAERVRLNGIVERFVMEPTTQPWGNRSMLFRDPDGNLINFYARAGEGGGDCGIESKTNEPNE